MIPRTGPRVEQLPALKLYREDLEKLLSIFREHCQNITFGDEEHLYDSLDEMQERSSSSLKCFAIQGFIPHGELVLRGSYAVPLAVQRSTLFVVERNQKSDLLFLSVRDFLRKREWFWMTALRKAFIAIGSIVLIGCFFLPRTLEGRRFLYELIVLLSASVTVVGVLMNTRQVSYITLSFRAKTQSFFARNSNNIAMAIMGSVLGAVVTLLVAWLKQVFR